MAQVVMVGAFMPKTKTFFFIKPNLTCKPVQHKITTLSVRALNQNPKPPPISGGNGGEHHSSNYLVVATEEKVMVEVSSGEPGKPNSDFLVAEEEQIMVAAVSTNPASSGTAKENKKNCEAETDDGEV